MEKVKRKEESMKKILVILSICFGISTVLGQFIKDDSTAVLYNFDTLYTNFPKTSADLMDIGNANIPIGGNYDCIKSIQGKFNKGIQIIGGTYSGLRHRLPPLFMDRLHQIEVQNISIEVWLNLYQTPDVHCLFSKINSYNLVLFHNQLEMVSPTWFDRKSDSIPITLDTWHYVAVTYALDPIGTADTLKFYFDGKLVNAVYEPHGLRAEPASAMYVGMLDTNIGTRPAYSIAVYTGKMDDLRITKGVRSPQEIDSVWKAANPQQSGTETRIICSGLVSLTAAPNPFNSSTTLRFTAPIAVPATLKLYSIDGSLVKTLWDGLAGGTQDIKMDGNNLSIGIYTAVLKTPDKTLTTNILLAH